ncbi:MAG: F0F1 ATP synthase subunit A [Bacteroidia bacterium]
MRLSAFFARLVLFTATVFLPALGFAYDPDAVDTLKHAHGDSAAAHQEHAAGEHKTGFDPGEMIMEHIADAHDWHLFGHTHIPLPVIIKSDKGLEIFSSSNFVDHETHAHVPYKGKHYTYALHEGKVVVVDGSGVEDEAATHTLLDLSITKNVVTIFVLVALMLFVFLSVAKSYKQRPGQAPKGLQSFVEPFIVFIRDDVAKASIGPKYARFMPYLLTVFFFIFFSNLLGLIPIFPGGANLTGNIAITMVLAVITFIITVINGNGHYWRHIFAMPGVPAGVLLILTPIEILGMFLRPFVLMIRLFANISAGHIIALAFYSLIFIFGDNGNNVGAGLGVSVVSIAFTVFMFVMELLVAFLQAYVFTLLSAIYFGSAVEEHHHEEHDHEHGHAHAH